MIRPAEASRVDVATEIAAAARILSMHRYGAVVVWDPVVSIAGGIVLDAVVSRELLVAVFSPESTNKLRTRLVAIRGTRVDRAGVQLTWQDVVAGAADLAVGVAFEVNEHTGEIRLVDDRGSVKVVEGRELADVLRRHAHAPWMAS